MPEIGIAFSGLIILFLFYRQLVIFKRRQKINYAPLVIIVGFIASASIFVFSQDTVALRAHIQFSLFPILIAMIFYIPMYLMHQIRINDIKLQEEDSDKQLKTFLSYLQEYFSVLDAKLSAIERTDENTLQALQMALKNELLVFKKLSTAQEALSNKLEAMYIQEESALINIQKFLDKDMIDLDTVVHRHIDILRISEQDHFNKMVSILKDMNDNKEFNGLLDKMDKVSSQLHLVEEGYKRNGKSIINEVKIQLEATFESISKELLSVKQLSETLNISTQEYDKKLQELHVHASKLLEQSDTIHESMEDTFNQSQKIRPVFASLNELVSRLMDIYGEYKQAKNELHILAHELGNAEERHFDLMDKKIDVLGEDIHKKIEASLYELKEHYHIADKDISTTVKTLAAKAKQSYSVE